MEEGRRERRGLRLLPGGGQVSAERLAAVNAIELDHDAVSTLLTLVERLVQSHENEPLTIANIDEATILIESARRRLRDAGESLEGLCGAVQS